MSNFVVDVINVHFSIQKLLILILKQ